MKRICAALFKNMVVLYMLLILTVIFFTAGQGNSEPVRGVTDDSIKIGVVMDLTGPTAGDIGLPITEALKNYTKHVNESGGIYGRKVKLLIEDDRYSIPASIAAFKKLLFKDLMFAFVGPGNTGAGRVLYPKLDKLRVPTMASVPDELTINPLKKHIFYIGTLYNDQLGVVYDYITNDLKPEKLNITFVYFDAESGKSGLTSTQKWAKYFNFDFKTEVINMGALDATSQAMSIRRNKSNFVVIHHASSATAALLRDLKKLGINIPVFGDAINCTEDMVRMAGSAAKNYIGAHLASSWYEDFEGVDRLRKITLKYNPGTEKPCRTKIYTVAWLLPTVLYEGLKRAGKDLNIDTLVGALERINDLDTGGISGPISFSPTNHKGLHHTKLYKAVPERGKLVQITDWRKTPEIK